MKVYLVRHGAYGMDYATEAGPGLSAWGKVQAQEAGHYLIRLGAAVSAVRTSPLLRARETASIIQEVLGTDLVPEEERVLLPEGDVETFELELRALGEAGEQGVLVVGHMCSIGELAVRLSREAGNVFGLCTVQVFEWREAEGRWAFCGARDCGKDAQ